MSIPTKINIEETLAVLNEVVIYDVESRNRLEVTITYNFCTMNYSTKRQRYHCTNGLSRTIRITSTVKIQPGFEPSQTLYTLFTSVTGYWRMGIIAKRSNKTSEAFGWFDRALEVDSQHFVTFKLIRMLHLDIDMSMSSSVPSELVCMK